MPDLSNPAVPPKLHWVSLTPRCLDAVERTLVVLVYLGLVGRVVASSFSGGGLADLLLLPSEGLVVAFLVFRRRPQRISQRPSDWLLAMSATLGPMLVVPGSGGPLIPAFAGAVIFLTALSAYWLGLNQPPTSTSVG